MTSFGELVASYDGRFPDEAAPGWSARTNGFVWELTLPNRHVLTLDPRQPGPFWREQPQADPTSTILWRNSLRPVLELQQSEGGWSATLPTIKSFADFLASFEGDYTPLKSGSFDHQLALALRSCATLRSRLANDPDPTPALRDQVLAALCRVVTEVCRAIVGGVEFLDNNHGIMLAIACEHAGLMFPEVPSASELSDEAQRFILPSLGIILDESGVVRENTPQYQKLYVSLMRQLSDFHVWAGLESSTTQELDRLTDLAEGALKLMLLPNGHIPPIGDATGGGAGYSPHPGELYSPSSGLFIWKDSETFISAVCGFRGVVHKQADDTSITLWHQGSHLIRDAGLLNYDETNELAVTLRSQRGHSGFFLERFDNLSARAFISFGANASRVKGTLAMTHSQDSQTIQMRKTHDGKSPLIRQVDLHQTDHRMVITDSFEGVPTASDQRISRFLFDPTLALTLSDNVLDMRSSTHFITIMAHGAASLRFYRGHTSEDAHSLIGSAALARGFVASAPHKVSKAWMVEYLHQGTGEDASVSFDVRWGTL